MARNNRSDAEYELGTLSKGIKVLEAMIGTQCQPANVATIMERTELPRHAVDSSLRTLRLMGYATATSDRKWTVGRRFISLADKVARETGG